MKKINDQEETITKKTVVLHIPNWSQNPVIFCQMGNEHYFEIDGIKTFNAYPYMRFNMTEEEERQLWDVIYS